MPPPDLVVRFTGLAHFAHQYGLNIRALAQLIADVGEGVAPFTRGHIASEDWRRIQEAERRLAQPGNWAETILGLLDEVAALKDQDRPETG